MSDPANTVDAVGPGCPSTAVLLAEAAVASDERVAHHLDGCARCQDLLTAVHRRARELADGGDPGCDRAEALLAELDEDDAALELDDRARLFIHLSSCESCRAAVEPPPDTLPMPTPGPTAPAGLPLVARTTYELGRELARGGMGRILRATDRRLGRTVAIKEVLAPRDLGYAELASWHARLEREARITARLNHPSIVSVHEAGVWPNGTPFFAMDLVDGRSLDAAIARARTLPERLALLPHAIQAADALAFAHHEGVVHRDLKPANVLVGSFGETVVIDWGLAKDLAAPDTGGGGASLAPAGDAALTRAGATLGTPAYMPPEQAEGEAVGRAADVYALGAMLYHLLTGRPPYAERSAAAALAAVRAGGPTPVTTLEPRVPQALAAIVAKAMARDPQARYPSAAELAAELRRFETGQLVLAHHYGPLDLLRHWLARRRFSVALVAGLAATLAITGVVGLAGILRERDRAAAAAERLTIARARAQIARDPTAAIALLRRAQLSPRGEADAGAVVTEAEAEGVAQKVLEGHAAPATWMTVGAGARAAVSGSRTGEVRLWDLASGGVKALGGRGGEISELALSPDGRTIAVADGHGLSLVDAQSGARRALGGHIGPVYTVGFTADGALVTGGEDGTVRRTDVASGASRILHGEADPGAAQRGFVLHRRPEAGARHVYTFHDATRDVTVALEAGGRVLGLERDGRVRWQAEHPAGMPLDYTLAAGVLATRGQDGALRVWRVDDGTVTVAGHLDDGRFLALSPDGQWLAATTTTSTVKLWDLRRGGERSLEGHTGQANRLAFAADGSLLASGGVDGTVRVWDPRHGELWTLRGHRAAVQWLAFGAGGALLSIADDGTARVWRPTPRGTRVLDGHTASVYRVAFGGARLFSVGLDHTLRVWDATAGSHVALEHPEEVWSLAVSPSGRLAVTSDAEHTCRLWEVAARAARVVGERSACSLLAELDPSERWIFTVDRGRTLRVWGAADLAAALTVDQVRGARWTGDGRLAYVTPAGDIVAAEAPGFAAKVIGHGPPPDGAVLSADGGVAVLRDAEQLTSLFLDGGNRGARAPVPDAPLGLLQIARSGARVVAGDQRGRLQVLDPATGRLVALAGHTQGVTVVALAASGRRAASSSQGELILWDLDTGAHQRLYGHASRVNDLAFNADGSLLASAGVDGTVRLWPVAAAATAATPLAGRLAALTEATLDDQDELAPAR